MATKDARVHSTIKPVALLIKYRGERLPKHVQLPIPFDQRCLQRGEVICNPIGEFPLEDGEALLALSGPEGLFQFHAYKYPDGRTTGQDEEAIDHLGRPVYRTFAMAKRAIKTQRLTGVHPERTFNALWSLVPDSPDSPAPVDEPQDDVESLDPPESSPATPDDSIPQEVV